MERTIKFKAKCLNSSEWVEGDLCHGFGGGLFILCFQEKEDGSVYFNGSHQIDPFTVCQFTGLKDKNGKEIWEGDYLKPIYDGYKPMKVIYKHGSFCLDTHYRGLEYLPLACCDIRAGELVKLEFVDRKEEK